jgi:HTH-type transcriptional regulator/antitoxin HigA
MTALARANRRTKPVRINRTKYGQLLARTQPAIIHSVTEYDRVSEEVTKLLKKGDRLTPEENWLLELLTMLIEKYDDENYEIPEATPHDVIQMLMTDRGLRHRDMMPVLGSRGVTSEVINGKRKPSKAQVKSLAAFFKMPPEVFISM